MNLTFKKSKLKNGLRVITESHPSARTVSLGVWILSGTRDEQKHQSGISHFLEHLVFKGTKTRSAFEIARSLDILGGELNAYTTREYTCYHALVLKEDIQKAIEVLSDLVTQMNLTEINFQTEKSVILQEITMSEDNIEEWVYDLYLEETLKPHPLSRPILGTQKSISQLTRKEVVTHYKTKYQGKQIIFAVAGSVEHSEVFGLVNQYLKFPKRRPNLQHKRTQYFQPKAHPFISVIEKPVEQLHVLLGFPCASFKETFRFESFLVNSLLGGGMTSKLYQSIREKKGLVYTIFSQLHTFSDFGMIHIYAACEPRQMKAVILNIFKELKKIRINGIRQQDLNLFKHQIKGSILMGSDDIENRMNSIAVNEMVFNKYRPVDEIIEEIEKVSVKSIRLFIDQYLVADQMGLLLVGAQAEQFQNWIHQEFKQFKSSFSVGNYP